MTKLRPTAIRPASTIRLEAKCLEIGWYLVRGKVEYGIWHSAN